MLPHKRHTCKKHQLLRRTATAETGAPEHLGVPKVSTAIPQSFHEFIAVKQTLLCITTPPGLNKSMLHQMYIKCGWHGTSPEVWILPRLG
jgi:hypothetical protein